MLGAFKSSLIVFGSLCILSGTGPAVLAQGAGASPIVPDVSPTLPAVELPVVEPALPQVDGMTAFPPAPPTFPLTDSPVQPAPPTGAGSNGGRALEVDGTVTPAAPPGEPPPAAAEDVVNVDARRFQYAFRLALSGSYDDNVNLRGGDQGGAFYFTVEPGVTVGYGDILGRGANYVRLDYSPSLYLYATQSEANSLQHLIRAEGQYLFPRITATLSQDVQILDGADLNVTNNTGTTTNRVNLDVSGRARVNIYVTRVIGSFSISDKTALNLALLYNNNAYESLISSQTFSGDFGFSYTYSPKLTLGIALAAGYLISEGNNSGQTFEQLNVRASYQTSGKLAVNGSFGLEARQFESGGEGNFTPVLELGLLYMPFDGTTISLSANRRVLSSASVAAANYTTTGFVVSGRQRLFQRYTAGLTFGYETASYFSTASSDGSGGSPADISREDNYFYVQPSVEVRLTPSWSVSVFYVHRENTSSGSVNTSFANNQFGVRTSYSF